MLHLASNQRYYLYQGPTDMRKGFDSLSGMVTTVMQQNPLSGDIYIFFNRRRNKVKLLHWEGDGFGLYYKRLEKGLTRSRYHWAMAMQELFTGRNCSSFCRVFACKKSSTGCGIKKLPELYTF